MKSKLLRGLVLAIGVTMCHLHMQAQTQVSGIVVNGEGEPQIANVLLLLPDSVTLVAGTLSTEQGFALHADSAGAYVMQVTCLGHKDLFTSLQIANGAATVGLDSLVLESDGIALSEVEITAHKVPFEATPEGLRVNVANTLLAKSANAQEMLSRSPGITVSGRQVLFQGRGEAVIYLDGKEIALETFRSLPVSEISHIEVVTNPSAKYDAKGKAVIVVTMKKSYHRGLLATLTDNATLGIVPGRPGGLSGTNNSSLNLDLRKGKVNLNAYYANDLGNTWSENHYSNVIRDAAGDYVARSHYEENSHATGVHYYRLGAGTQLGRRGNLSAQYDGLSHHFRLDVAQDANYTVPSGATTAIAMRNAATTRLLNHSGNLNYHLGLDSLGSELFCGVQANVFGNQLLDHITEEITRPASASIRSNKVNDSQNLIHLYMAQADVTQALPKGLKLEAGAKFSHITNEGSIRFFSKQEQDAEYVENPLFANGNRYTENVSALYAQLSGKVLQWNMRLGLRGEYSDVEGYSQKLQQYLIDSTYANLFPSLLASRGLGKHWNLRWSLGRKINRPLYQDLDPFLWYLDSLTSIQGNPKLTPELVDQAEAALSFRSITLRAGYTRSTHTLWMVPRTGSTGPNSVVYTKDNLEQRHTFTTALDAAFENKWYNSWTSLTMNYWKFVDSRPQYKGIQPFPQLYLYTYHQFLLPKGFRFDLTAEYYSAASDGMTRRKPFYYVTMGASRSFLRENLSVSLMFNDVFRTAVWGGVRTQGVYVNDYNQRYMLHYLRLSATLKLGGVTRFNYRNKAINEKEFGRIKQ